jgi:hypothetical protein
MMILSAAEIISRYDLLGLNHLFGLYSLFDEIFETLRCLFETLPSSAVITMISS